MAQFGTSFTWPYKIRLTIRPEYVPADFNDWTLVFDQDFNPIFQEPDSPLALNGPRPMGPHGGDIRFSLDKEGEQRLPCHIREATLAEDPADARFEVAVKLPFVSSSNLNIIWMWWGVPDVTQPSPAGEFGQFNTYRESAYAYIPDAYVDDVTDPENSPIVDTQGGLVLTPDEGLVGPSLDSTTNTGQIRYTPERNIMGTAFTTIFGYYKRGKGGGDRGSFLGENANNRFGHRTTAGDESLHLIVAGTTRTQTPQLPNNEWHAVAVKRDGTTWTSRANRVAGTTGSSTTVYPVDATIGMGTTANRAPDGIIDEYQIYTEALSDTYIDVTQDNLLNTDAPRGILTWGYVFYPEDITTGEPEVNSPTIHQTHHLGTENIETNHPRVNDAVLEAERLFIPENLRTGPPEIEGATLIYTNHLEADDLVGPAPVLQETILLLQIHRLTSTPIQTDAPELDESIIHQTHNIVKEQLAGSTPVLEDSFIHQTHNIIKEQFVGPTPELDDAFIGKGHLVMPEDLTGPIPVVGSPAFKGIHNFGAFDLWTTPTIWMPELGRPVFRERHNFVPQDIATPPPSKIVGVKVFIYLHPEENEIIAGVPEVNDADNRQLHKVRHDQTTMPTPDLGTAGITQTHRGIRPRDLPRYLIFQGHVYEPKFTDPTLNSTHEILADDLIGQAPEVNDATLTVVFNFDGDNIVGEAPVVGESDLTERYVFFTEGITGEAAVVNESEISQTHVLALEDLEGAMPFIDTSFLIQDHVFGGDGITASPPVLGEPELVMSVSYIAADIFTDEPVVGESIIDQIHNLAADQQSSPSPILGDSVLFIKETQELIAMSFRTGFPVVNRTGINGFDEPPPIEAPNAGVGTEGITLSRDAQIIRQLGYLRRYSPTQIRDAWHNTGQRMATPHTPVYGGGGLFKVNDINSSMNGAILLFLAPRFTPVDWSKYEITGRMGAPYPRNKETGTRLMRAYVLLTPDEVQAIEEDVDADFEAFYVRRKRIPLITE